MKPTTLATLALLLAAAGASAMLKPAVIATKFPTADVVIASQVITAPDDGVADAAPAIQAAIDEAAKAGGATLFLPAGRYRLATPLALKEGVTLRGDGSAEHLAASTLLMPVAGRGQETGPAAITVDRGTGLRELAIWYPEQSIDAPVPYPWAVAISPRVTGDNHTLVNVTLVNPWRGVKIGPESNELHTLEHVSGTPLKTGLFVDSTTDIGRLTDLDFAPHWWADSGLPGAPSSPEARAKLAAWLRANATGCDMGRSDWEYMYQVKVSGYATGLAMHAGALGTANAVMYGCVLTGGAIGLRLEGLNGVGLACTGCRFQGDVGVLMTPAFTTVAQFNTCTMSNVKLDGRGTATFLHCTFDGPLEAAAGNVVALDSQWTAAGRAVTLGQGVRRARVLSCRFNGAPDIADLSHGDVEVAHTPLVFDRPSIAPHVPAPTPRPKSARLFDVTDYGAATAATDNTPAMQSALDAAGAAGGGTVYVPAGRYRIAGSLHVPGGVELRGIFDVPHHTQSAGSVLFVLGGKGQEDGPPLIQLAASSGVRGMTVWWPEQDVANPTPYPWAVRSLGPGCWVVDVTLGNAWDGVDFSTYPSTGHVVKYLAGGMLRRGLWVSKSDGDGWVEDMMYNPHYMFRLPPNLPHPPFRAGADGAAIAFQRAHLEGLAFGRCAREHVRGTFLYSVYDGIAFRDDGGGTNARVIMHGSDTVSRSAFVEAVGAEGVECHLFQLTPLSDQAVAAFVTDPKFNGKVAFHNSQIWAGNTTALLQGPGQVTLSQLNTLTGPVRVTGGSCRLEGAVFERDWRPAVRLEAGCASAWLLANVAPGPLAVENAIGDKAWVRAGSASADAAFAGPATQLAPDRFQMHTNFAPGEPQAPPDTVAEPGGGIHTVAPFTCRPVAGAGPNGTSALRLAGTATDPSYSYIYCRALDGPYGVRGDTVLSYQMKPENEHGRWTCVDIVFSDGSTLRDSQASTNTGTAARGAGESTKVGEWTRIDTPLGRWHAGKVIQTVMLAYDSRNGGGPFSVLISDLSLTSDAAGAPGAITPRLDGRRLMLDMPAGLRVRYTLDGLNPTPASPLAVGAIQLPGRGLQEVRWSREVGADRLAGAVEARVVDAP